MKSEQTERQRRASIDHPIFPGREKLRGIDVFHLRLDGHAGSRRHLTDRALEPVGIAVMGGIMRAADPGQEVRALLAIVAGARRSRQPE